MDRTILHQPQTINPWFQIMHAIFSLPLSYTCHFPYVKLMLLSIYLRIYDSQFKLIYKITECNVDYFLFTSFSFVFLTISSFVKNTIISLGLPYFHALFHHFHGVSLSKALYSIWHIRLVWSDHKWSDETDQCHFILISLRRKFKIPDPVRSEQNHVINLMHKY